MPAALNQHIPRSGYSDTAECGKHVTLTPTITLRFSTLP